MYNFELQFWLTDLDIPTCLDEGRKKEGYKLLRWSVFKEIIERYSLSRSDSGRDNSRLSSSVLLTSFEISGQTRSSLMARHPNIASSLSSQEIVLLAGWYRRFVLA